MPSPRAYRALACLSLTLPAVAWAGFGNGRNSPLIVLFPLMLLVSAVMLLALVVSLFTSRRSLTKHTYAVVAADLAAVGLLMVSGDDLAEVFAWFLGIAAGLLLFIAVLVHAGESMLKEAKTKRGSSRPPRQPPVRDSE